MQNLLNCEDRKTVYYGFQGRLRSEFPSQIIADITEVCNLECIHCPHTEFATSEHYAARHLDTDLNAKMVDEVREYGEGITQYIRYASNGEPLLHPHAYEMIEYAVKYSGVYVTLTTNGTAMNESNIQRLLNSGIHMIDISIDAFTNETYSKVRLNGNLNRTRANVLRLIEMIKKSRATTRVVVSFVEQPLNRLERGSFETYWKDQGVDYVVIRRLHSCSGAKGELASHMRNENESKLRRPCLYPWERVVLNAMGVLIFCPADWFHGSPIKDYRETTIRETWQGEFYERLLRAHLNNDFSEFGFCEQCPDWKSTSWPWEDRSYSDMIQEIQKDEQIGNQ